MPDDKQPQPERVAATYQRGDVTRSRAPQFRSLTLPTPRGDTFTVHPAAAVALSSMGDDRCQTHVAIALMGSAGRDGTIAEITAEEARHYAARLIECAEVVEADALRRADAAIAAARGRTA